MSSLATVLYRQGKLEEAEDMQRKVLQGHEELLGREHPNTLGSLCNLATTFYELQRYSDALALYQQAYDGFLKALGVHHPRTVRCLCNLELARKRKDIFLK